MNKRRRFQAKRKRALVKLAKRPASYVWWEGQSRPPTPEVMALIEQDMKEVYRACISNVQPESFDVEWFDNTPGKRIRKGCVPITAKGPES